MALNDPRGPDPGRDLAEELAERLAGDDGQRLLRLLQMAGFLAPADGGDVASDGVSSGDVPDGDVPRGPVPISIWRPAGDSVFERPPPLPLGDHYATTRTLRAAKAADTRRVVLLGESVAAGYLYAPNLTPAAVLERQLRTLAPERGYEVVDLARTNERLDTLSATAEAAMQLAPDALVVFAGNNWSLLETPETSPLAPGVRGRQRLALALRESGLRGAIELARRRLAARARAGFERLAALSRDGGPPVVVVVPEVDVKDWDARAPVHALPGDGVPRWYRHLETSREAFAAGRPQTALAEADAMLALDSGLCPTGHRLRARALEALDRGEQAAEAWHAAVDAAGHYPTLAFLGAPQATRPVQALLRRLAAAHRFAVVDLPRIFAEHTGWTVPDRRLFLDYCHLDREGIRLAMAATAAELLALDGRRGSAEPGDADWRRAFEASPPIELAPAAEATALIGAAIHTAHRLVPIDRDAHRALLEARCRAALDADPGVADACRHLLAARAAALVGWPAVLTAAQADNLASPYRLSLQHGWRWDHLDLEVLRAAETAIAECDGRAGEALAVDDRLAAACSPGPDAVDLLAPPFPAAPLERFFPEAMAADSEPRAFLRVPWPRVRFWLPVDEPRDLELALVVRLPPTTGPAATGRLAVHLDGRELTTLGVDSRWRRHAVSLPAESLRTGLSRLTLRWPLPATGDDPLAPRIARLERGLDAPLHPIFGEIHTLRAHLA